MCPVNVRVGKLIRIAEAEVDVRLRCEMEDGVDLVLTQHALHVGRRRNVPILESEVWLVLEDARIVQSRAVIELVVGDDIVLIWVREDEMADEPTGAVWLSAPAHRALCMLARWRMHSE